MKCSFVSLYWQRETVPQSCLTQFLLLVGLVKKQPDYSSFTDGFCVKPQKAFFRQGVRQGVDNCVPTATIWANSKQRPTLSVSRLTQHKTSHKQRLSTAVQTGPRVMMELYIGVISHRHLRKQALKAMEEDCSVFTSHALLFRTDLQQDTVLHNSINWLHICPQQELNIYNCSLCGENLLSRFTLSFLSSTCVVLSLTKWRRLSSLTSAQVHVVSS